MAENRQNIEAKEGTPEEVLAIHGNLKDEICKILAGKRIKKEQRQNLESMLLKIYQDVVAESVKGYFDVAREGMRPTEAVSTASSKACTSTDAGHLSQQQSEEADSVFSNLEAVIRSCTSKRKSYPQRIADLLEKSYHHQQDILENYVPTFRGELGLSTNATMSASSSQQECESCVDRLGQVAASVSDLSKTIQRVTEKAERLSESYDVHKTVEEDGLESLRGSVEKQRLLPDKTLVGSSILSVNSPEKATFPNTTHRRKSKSPHCYKTIK